MAKEKLKLTEEVVKVEENIDFGKIAFSDITNEYGDLSTTGVFYQVFKGIPNFLSDEKSIDSKHSMDYIQKTYRGEIDYIYDGSEKTELEGEKVYCITYIFKGKLIVRVSDNKLKFYYRDRKDPRIDDIQKHVKKHSPKKTKEAYISFILQGHGGLKTVDSKLMPREIVLAENYNDDLVEKSVDIIKQLNEEKSGIYLFHGDPGTGKSNYIRWLKTQTEKKFIFMPLNVAANIDSPELLGLMMGNEGCVLIIEDAEKLVVSREGNHNSTIAALLNLSDGLIGQTLNIQVICTFNTALSKVDKALQRKGRLLTHYEFKKLSLQKTKDLFKKCGHEGEINEELLLTDIYNFDQEEYKLEKKDRIGFVKTS